MRNWICKNGIFFSGKVKELHLVLDRYILNHETLRDIIKARLH